MPIIDLTPANTSFQWIDIMSPTEDELLATAEKYGIHKYSMRDCMEPDHLPKVEHLDAFTFIISRFYIDDKLAIENAHSIQKITSKLAFFYNDKVLITIHRLPIPFLEEIKHKYIENRFKSPSVVVVRMLWHVLKTFEPPAIKLMNEIDEYEERIFLKSLSPTMMKHLYFIKRKTHIIHKLMTISMSLIRGIQCQDKVALNDLEDYNLKLNSIYGQNLDDVHSLLNFYLSISSQKTNEVMRILTVFSAFFLPLTFIAGVYGMNFEFMPELHHRYGYITVWVVMILITIIIFQWFWRKKWL